MYCKTCGKEINKETGVCDNCGPVVAAPVNQPIKQKKQGLPIWAIVLIVFIPIILIGFLIAIPIFLSVAEESTTSVESEEKQEVTETKLFEGVTFELPTSYYSFDSYGSLTIVTDDGDELAFQTLEMSFDTLKSNMESMTLADISSIYADNGGIISHVEFDLDTPLDTIALNAEMADGSSAVLTYSKKADGNILVGAYVKDGGATVNLLDIDAVESLYSDIMVG